MSHNAIASGKYLCFFIIVAFFLLFCFPVSAEHSYEFGIDWDLADQVNILDFPNMNEGQRDELVITFSRMSVYSFNTVIENASVSWTDDQKREFIEWLVKKNLLNNQCDIANAKLSTTFELPRNFDWPFNVPTPSQGHISKVSQGENAVAVQIKGATRLTYEEMKIMLEAAGAWIKVDAEEGKTKIKKVIKNNFGPSAKTTEESLSVSGIEMVDDAYFKRADEQGWTEIAFGGNTIELICENKGKVDEADSNEYKNFYHNTQKGIVELEWFEIDDPANRAKITAVALAICNMDYGDAYDAMSKNRGILTREMFEEFNYLMLQLKNDIQQGKWPSQP